MNVPRKYNGLWLTAVVLALPMLYVASFGPACWLTAKPFRGTLTDDNRPPAWMVLYAPIGKLMSTRTQAASILSGWMMFGIKQGEGAGIPEFNSNRYQFQGH